MAQCDKLIKGDIKAACEGLLQGAENEGLIINREDIDTTASEFVYLDPETKENPTCRLTLALKSGAKAYVVKQLGKTPFTGTQDAFEEGTYINTFSHTVNMVILDASPEVADNFIDPIANGSFVVILKTKNPNMNADKTEYRYKVYGYDQGLHMTEGTAELYNDETLGGWSVSMQETKSSHSAIYLEGGDEAYESLKTAV